MGRAAHAAVEPELDTSLFYTGAMLKALCTAMMCLLALAIPMQGLAAATMRLCDTAHPHHTVHGIPTVPTDRAQEFSACHDHAGAADRKNCKPFDRKCNVCVVCAASAALPTHLIVLQAAKAGLLVQTDVATAPIGFLTDAPDRPPRSLSD